MNKLATGSTDKARTEARTEDWKDKYFKALNELDELERASADRVTRVSRDLLALLERHRGTNAAFDRDLDLLVAKGPLHDDTQQSRLRGLVALLERQAPPAEGAAPTPPAPAPAPTATATATAPPKAAPDDGAAALRTLFAAVKAPQRLEADLDRMRSALAAPQAAELATLAAIAEQLSQLLCAGGEERVLAGRDALQSLIDHLSLPAVAQARLGAITPQLQQAHDSTTVRRIAKALADFVVEYVTSLASEVSGLNSFLVVIKSRLGDVSGFIDLEKQERSVARAARDDLNASVRSSLDTMRGRVSGADDIEQLKQDIQQQIAIIDGNVSAFMKAENTRGEHVDAQHGKLAQELAALGSETEKLRKQLHEAQAQAIRDTLTGLPNRLAYNDRMLAEFARWQRQGRDLALVVFDIDRFKVINDTWGHQAGDRVLKLVARELAGQIRAQDFLGRYGGEEFVLVLPDTGRAGALKLADGLRRHIESCRFKFKDEPVNVTISCGIAELVAGDTIARAFERADRGLYAAKENGRNRCEMALA